MIHCKYCGITYRDSATLCLRCRIPLPRPAYVRSNKTIRQDSIKTESANKTLIATATPPPPRVLGMRIG